MLLNNKSGSQSIILPQLPRSTSNKDLKTLALSQISDNLLQDPQNVFNFYQIEPYDNLRLKKKSGTNYRSVNILSDLSLVRGAQFYKKKHLNFMEKQIRKDLKNQVGCRQLLSEIYEQLEEDVPAMIDNKKDGQIEEYEKKRQEEKNLVEMKKLDDFTKKIKAEKAAIRKQIEEDEERQKQERELKERGINRRLSLISIINNQKQKILLSDDKTDTKKSTNKQSITVQPQIQITKAQIQRSAKSQPSLAGLLQRGLNNQQNFLDGELQQVELQKQFAQALQGLQKSDPQKQTLVNDKDREVRKQLVKYMNKVNIDADDNDQQNNDYDFTPDGVKMMIESLYLNMQSEQCNTVVDKAKMFEKNSNKVENKIINKLANFEAILINKSKLERTLRLENHSLLTRISSMRDKISQLEDEIKNNKDNDKKGKSFAYKSSHNSGEIGLDIHPDGQELDRKQSTSSNMGISKASTRQQQIDELLKKAQKDHSIEDRIASIKQQIKKHEVKIVQNKGCIKDLEHEINQKRRDIKMLRLSLQTFFLEILKRGKDSRQEGLSWIIRQIYKMGEKVYQMFMPEFLDQRAQEYLINKAQNMMQLLEYKNLVESQLDIYKINLNIRKEEEQRILRNQNKPKKENESDSDTESNPENEPNQSNYASISNYDASMISQIGKGQNTSLPLITPQNQSIVSANQTISQIDINFVRQVELIKRKYKEGDYSPLKYGLSSEYSSIIDKTIDELIKPKQTSNDILYNETQKKVVQTMRNWASTKIIDPNNNSQIQEIEQDQYQTVNLPFKILLFENDTQLNNYTNREEFIKEYNELQAKIEGKNKVLRSMEEAEIQRIIREFDFKQYGQKFKIDCPSVLGALFGAQKADKLIIRFGMMQK